MKRVLVPALFGFVMLIVGYSLPPTSISARPRILGESRPQSHSRSDFKLLDIVQFEWVDKRCRMWAPDGDIDVDQTCLVVKTVGGGLNVIPNVYNDEWLKEIADPKTSDDKWIQRFFAMGGGRKVR